MLCDFCCTPDAYTVEHPNDGDRSDRKYVDAKNKIYICNKFISVYLLVYAQMVSFTFTFNRQHLDVCKCER